MVFADFCGLNNPMMANFKVPVWTELVYRFCENLTVGFYVPEQSGSSTPLPIASTLLP